MFARTFGKVYVVNESSLPKGDFKYITKTPVTLYKKNEYPTLETYYRHLSRSKDSNITIIPFRDNEFNSFMLDYCNLLGLNYEAYLAIVKHSNFCCLYEDNCQETISLPGPTPLIPEELFILSNKKFDAKFYPAEIAINHLDIPWVQQKYEWFRIYDIYQLIKNIQFELYKMDLEIPEVLSIFNSSDQSAKQLFNKEIYSKVKNYFSFVGIDTSLFYMPIEDYTLSLINSFGYTNQTMSHFNWSLARELRRQNFKIDERCL